MSKKGNILILSRREDAYELIQDFKTEAAKFSDGIRVLTTDINPMSSACLYPTVLSPCRRYVGANISTVFSTWPSRKTSV